MRYKNCVYIYIYPDPLLHTQDFEGPSSSECSRVSVTGNGLWLNPGTCIRLMLNGSVLHDPASSAVCMGQSVVSDYGLIHAWLFPQHAMAVSSNS